MTTSEKIKKLKEALKDLENKEEISEKAGDAYELDPENPEKEKAFDDTYKVEFAAFMSVSASLAKLIGIDEKTARAMIGGKRAEVWNILNRAI